LISSIILCFSSLLEIELQGKVATSHFSDKNIEIGLVCSNFDKIIFIITTNGTDKSIPIIHHKYHQKLKAMIITRGLRFSLFPIILGSITFQTIICIVVNKTTIKILV
jgi:hypothetical protein